MVQIALTIEVEDEYADASHESGITDDANQRLFGGEGIWLGDIVDGPTKVAE